MKMEIVDYQMMEIIHKNHLRKDVRKSTKKQDIMEAILFTIVVTIGYILVGIVEAL